MSVQLPCIIVCINICAGTRGKSQTLAAIRVSEHKKILHTLVVMGSAALAAAVALNRPGDITFPRRMNEAKKKKKKTGRKKERRKKGQEI